MKFNYKTNFECGKERQRYIDKIIKKGQFYKNKDGIVISKEYPKNEAKNIKTNLYSKKNFHDKKRKHYLVIEKLCKKYYSSFDNVLEVGAGTGYFAKKYIDKFKPKTYTIYDTSNAMIKRAKKKLQYVNFTKINIKNKSFKNISKQKMDQYDCVIAIEVLEHINWDKEFLFKIGSGKWIFFSVPRIQGFLHVRAYFTPDSIAYRYRDILDIHEIREVRRNIRFKSEHNFPLIFAVAAKRKNNYKILI